MPRRILVTGAQGFVGRYLVHALLQDRGETRVLGIGRSAPSLATFTHAVSWGHDRVPAPLPRLVAASVRDPRYEYQAVDICDSSSLTAVIRDFQPGVVVHLAGALRDDPVDRLIHNNVEAVARLIEAVANAGLKAPRIVLGSTGGVYGAPAFLPIGEDSPCIPVDVYAATKRAAEEIARVMGVRHGISILIGRIFNPMGSGQDERHVCGALCARLIAIRAGLFPPVLEVGALDTTRDFIDVADLARALAILVRHGEPGRVYNVASGRETCVETILNSAIALSGLQKLELRSLTPRRGDIPRHVADISRLRALGFSVTRSIDESLRDMLRYYDEAVRAASTAAAKPRASGRHGVEVKAAIE